MATDPMSCVSDSGLLRSDPLKCSMWIYCLLRFSEIYSMSTYKPRCSQYRSIAQKTLEFRILTFEELRAAECTGKYVQVGTVVRLIEIFSVVNVRNFLTRLLNTLVSKYLLKSEDLHKNY